MENNIINQFINNLNNNKKTTEQILNQYQKIREDYKKTQKLNQAQYNRAINTFATISNNPIFNNEEYKVEFFNNNFILIIEALKKTIKLTTK